VPVPEEETAGADHAVWVDAQLPPALARWLVNDFGLNAAHVQDLGLLHARDSEIFERARAAGAVVVTKDLDFVLMLERFGPPPRVVWITAGNLTKGGLQGLVRHHWERVMELLARGEPLIEISGRR
jgi:predicted nuclease of predicted toxin-antitoxin system